MPQPAPMHFKVAFLGFSDFERGTLASCFRLVSQRTPSFEQVLMLTEAHFLVADADHPPSVQLVQATERQSVTVFVGSQAPADGTAWLPRPIDALQVVRELDAMVVLAHPSAVIIQPGIEPLPMAAEPLQPPRKSRRQAATTATTATTATPRASALPPADPRVLLVDDSQIALRFLETRLARWRLQIDRASTSAQALDLLAAHSYDLVFLDVELGPGSALDGMALCQRIKQSAATVDMSVVLVSAHHSELDRVRGALAGCDAYLAKPLDEVELQRLLLRHGFKLPRSEGADVGATAA